MERCKEVFGSHITNSDLYFCTPGQPDEGAFAEFALSMAAAAVRTDELICHAFLCESSAEAI
jgi:hypothetical protein